MNILHLSAVKNWGGGENHIENLCRELKELAPDVNNRILCIEDSPFHQKLNKSNVQVIPAKLAFKMDPRYFIELINTCKSVGIDLIHIHDTTALTLAVMGNKFYDLPPFIFSKKTSFPIKPRKQTLYKYNHPKIKKILCVSKATQRITAESITDQRKLSCIYHGTNTTYLNGSKPVDLREQFQIKKDAFLIGNIANHIRSKNLETLIKVANELVHNHQMKNLHFIQIGSFTQKTKQLLDLVKDYNLEQHITFTDFIPGAAGIIPQFDLSLMTSQSEGLPQFIYESFYHEVPVVSTNVGGISELIEHNENGLLAPAHDHITLATQILKLIKDPELRKKLSKGSRKNIQENFTTTIMAQKTLAEYKNVLNGRS